MLNFLKVYSLIARSCLCVRGVPVVFPDWLNIRWSQMQATVSGPAGSSFVKRNVSTHTSNIVCQIHQHFAEMKKVNVNFDLHLQFLWSGLSVLWETSKIKVNFCPKLDSVDTLIFYFCIIGLGCINQEFKVEMVLLASLFPGLVVILPGESGGTIFCPCTAFNARLKSSLPHLCIRPRTSCLDHNLSKTFKSCLQKPEIHWCSGFLLAGNIVCVRQILKEFCQQKSWVTWHPY